MMGIEEDVKEYIDLFKTGRTMSCSMTQQKFVICMGIIKRRLVEAGVRPINPYNKSDTDKYLDPIDEGGQPTIYEQFEDVWGKCDSDLDDDDLEDD